LPSQLSGSSTVVAVSQVARVGKVAAFVCGAQSVWFAHQSARAAGRLYERSRGKWPVLLGRSGCGQQSHGCLLSWRFGRCLPTGGAGGYSVG
jgi:hypothetical protein